MTNQNYHAVGILVLLALVMFSACSKDDDDNQPTTPPYIVESALFDCPYSVATPQGVDFAIRDAYVFSEWFILAGTDEMAIINRSSNEVVVSEDYRVNSFGEYNSRLLICTDEGVFELVDAGDVLRKINDVRCSQLFVTSKEEVLIVPGFGSSNTSFLGIYQLDMEGDLVDYFTGPYPFTEWNRTIFMQEAGNGDLWLYQDGGVIFRLRDKEAVDFFDEENSGLTLADLPEAFLFPFGEEMIYVSKNGTFHYEINKFANGEWKNLLRLSQTGTEQEFEILLPTLINGAVKGDRLYLATSFASCRGFQVFDLRTDDPFDEDDYFTLRDPNFDSQCTRAFSINKSGEAIVVTDNQIHFFDC